VPWLAQEAFKSGAANNVATALWLCEKGENLPNPKITKNFQRNQVDYEIGVYVSAAWSSRIVNMVVCVMLCELQVAGERI
jgi:hypothetical protein